MYCKAAFKLNSDALLVIKMQNAQMLLVFISTLKLLLI